VSLFRSKFLGGPGLDGCLLELEEILKLKASTSFEATLLTSFSIHQTNAIQWIALPQSVEIGQTLLSNHLSNKKIVSIYIL
jgi:hypothetical protein